jgi:hypothetical protein
MGLLDKAKKTVSNAVSSVKKTASKAVNTVKNVASSTSKAVQNTASTATKAVQNTASSTKKAVQNTASTTKKAVQNTASKVSNTVKTISETAKKTSEPVSNTVKTITETPNKIAETVKTIIPESVSTVKNTTADTLKNVSSGIETIVTKRDENYEKAVSDIGSGNVAKGATKLTVTTAADVVLPLDLANVGNKLSTGRASELGKEDFFWAGVDAVTLIPTPVTVVGGKALKTLKGGDNTIKISNVLKGLKTGSSAKVVEPIETIVKPVAATEKPITLLTKPVTTVTKPVTTATQKVSKVVAQPSKTVSTVKNDATKKLADLTSQLKLPSVIKTGSPAAVTTKIISPLETLKTTDRLKNLTNIKPVESIKSTLNIGESAKVASNAKTVSNVTGAAKPASSVNKVTSILKPVSIGLAGAGLYSLLSGDDEKENAFQSQEMPTDPVIPGNTDQGLGIEIPVPEYEYIYENPQGDIGFIPDDTEIWEYVEGGFQAIIDWINSLFGDSGSGAVPQEILDSIAEGATPEDAMAEYIQYLNDLLESGQISPEEYNQALMEAQGALYGSPENGNSFLTPKKIIIIVAIAIIIMKRKKIQAELKKINKKVSKKGGKTK